MLRVLIPRGRRASITARTKPPINPSLRKDPLRASFDHLVGAGEEDEWNLNTESFCCPAVKGPWWWTEAWPGRAL
jgi:hypothetical protein